MASAPENFTTAAHQRLRKSMQWNAIWLAGLSVSEQKNNKAELGFCSYRHFEHSDPPGSVTV